MAPLVSIIMPTFNRALLLPTAIRSVINQTYFNWELIIIDDKSTDDSIKVVESFTNQDIRIRLIVLDNNSGACVARNIGIEEAQGEFVTFLDSDDEYLPAKVELQVKVFKESDIQNLGVVSCGRQDYRDGEKYHEWIPSKRGNILHALLSKDKIGAGTPFLMVRKECIERYKIRFDPEMPAAQDWDFLVGICQHCNFDFVPLPLVRVHHHKGERVYTNKRALVALEKQYTKYNALISSNVAVHDNFLLKMAVQNFVYGNRDNALHILRTKLMQKGIKSKLWYLYIYMSRNHQSITSRGCLKLLNHFTFN